MIIPPVWGIPVILVVGIAVVWFGWWADRRADARQSQGYTPQSEVNATDSPTLAADRLAGLWDRLPTAFSLATAVPDAFLTTAAPTTPSGSDPAPRGPLAALEQPLVLLADADLSDAVALVPALRHARSEGRSLVLVARGFDGAILETLNANARTGRVQTLPVAASSAVLAQLSEITCASVLSAQDWTSGWLPANAWGSVDGWISDADRSWLILPTDPD